MSKRNTAKKVREQEIVESVEVVETEGKGRKTYPAIELTKAQQKTYDELKTTSAKIRWLASEGFATGQIDKFLGIRYQHVRNVLTTPLKRQLA